jgi:hypothetical protein
MKKFQWIASSIGGLMVAIIPYSKGDKALVVIAIFVLLTAVFKLFFSLLYNDINK